MEDKKIITRSKEEQLLDARREGLLNAEKTSIRPHGKLWEMDVFSWYKPNLHILANTIHAFPFPVIWVGNSKDIIQVLEEDSTLDSNLYGVFAYDSAKFIMELDPKFKLKNSAGTNSVDHTLSLIQAIKQKNTVLLFTSTDLDWSDKKEYFDDFLKLNQKK